MEESEIQENTFHLIFAFDEIVALGYRESVNLAQIRTFVEMDSHEEKVYRAVRETQEREARTKMKVGLFFFGYFYAFHDTSVYVWFVIRIYACLSHCVDLIFLLL